MNTTAFPFNTAHINQLMRTRRTIKPKNYSKTRISDTIIKQLLENANWAPNHGLNQPWRFIVFSDAARERLGNFEAAWYKSNTLPIRFAQKKYDKYKNRVLQASHIIAINMHRLPNTKIPEIEDIEAVACAVQNMWLSATAYGISAYWASGGATYSPELHEFLALAPNERCLGFLYLGIPKPDIITPLPPRQNIAKKTTWLSE